MLLGGFVGAVIVGYLTSFLGGLAPSSTLSGEHSPWALFLIEAIQRILREAPLLLQGAVLVAAVLVLKEGLAPSLFGLLRRWERWGWLLLLPAVLLFLGLRVSCEQAGLCLP